MSEEGWGEGHAPPCPACMRPAHPLLLLPWPTTGADSGRPVTRSCGTRRSAGRPDAAPAPPTPAPVEAAGAAAAAAAAEAAGVGDAVCVRPKSAMVAMRPVRGASAWLCSQSLRLPLLSRRAQYSWISVAVDARRLRRHTRGGHSGKGWRGGVVVVVGWGGGWKGVGWG